MSIKWSIDVIAILVVFLGFCIGGVVLIRRSDKYLKEQSASKEKVSGNEKQKAANKNMK